jgi:glutathione S-transferase
MTVKKLTLVSHHLCPYVQRAAIALAEKGIEFERVYIDLAAKPEWFTAVSPLGKVPLLIVDQQDGSQAVIFESAVICEYIEDALPGPNLHPADPLTRARHRAWMEFGSAILADIWGLETAKDEATYLAKRASVAVKFARVDSALAEGPFFSGNRFALVDAVFAPIFRYFDVFDDICETGVFDGLVKLRIWRAALADRHNVVNAVTMDYRTRLLAFLREHDAFLLRMPVGHRTSQADRLRGTAPSELIV